ncbi:MAG: sigma-70 family RNA polymerase sigma factor [Gemmataceae bacterium]|nr:sigma-70 family RNA polymerase sigma factor [Gemmataceae bacterium]
MPKENAFLDSIRKIRAGDEQAATELVRRYEPLIRREIRLRLADRRLERAFDSMDVCQSVLGSFFIRAAAGEYDLENPEQLVGLLVKMARNKLASAARKQYRRRRDTRRQTVPSDDLDRLPGKETPPSEQLRYQEQLAQVLRALTDEERQLAQLRSQGRSWDDIAAELGGTGNARRMQLARAVSRVVKELGFEEADAGR